MPLLLTDRARVNPCASAPKSRSPSRSPPTRPRGGVTSTSRVEHLLYALLFDEATALVVRHAGGDPAALKKELETVPRRAARERPRRRRSRTPTASLGVQRAIRRADDATCSRAARKRSRARTCSSRSSPSATRPPSTSLEKSGVTRLDVVAYISHGDLEARRGRRRAARARSPRRSTRDGEGPRSRKDPLEGLHDQPQRGGRGEAHRSARRPRERGHADDPDPRAAEEEQPAARRRRGRRQDRDRRGPRAQDRRTARCRRRSRSRPSTRSTWARSSPARATAATSRSASRASSRRSRSIDGAILFIDEIHTIVGAGATSGGSMDASNLLKPALAVGPPALHRLDDVRGVPPALREGPRARAALPARRGATSRPSRTRSKILAGLVAVRGVRGVPRASTLHASRDHDGARQGIDLLDELARASYLTRDRRPAATRPIDLHRTKSGAAPRSWRPPTRRPDEATSATGRRRRRATSRRCSRAWRRSRRARSRANDKEKLRNLDVDLKGVVFGQDDAIDQLAAAIKLARAGLRAPEKPIGIFLFTGPDRRRQDGGRQAARQDPGHRVPALRHERVHGAPHRLAPHRRAAGLRRLRSRRPAHRRDREDAARRAPARRDREGAPRRLQRARSR